MSELDSISALSDVQQLVRDIPIQCRESRDQFAPAFEIEAVQQIKDDPGCLLQVAASTDRLARFQFSFSAGELREQELVLLGNALLNDVCRREMRLGHVRSPSDRKRLRPRRIRGRGILRRNGVRPAAFLNGTAEAVSLPLGVVFELPV